MDKDDSGRACVNQKCPKKRRREVAFQARELRQDFWRAEGPDSLRSESRPKSINLHLRPEVHEECVVLLMSTDLC